MFTDWLVEAFLDCFSGYPRYHIAHNITEYTDSTDEINVTVLGNWKSQMHQNIIPVEPNWRGSHVNLSIGTDVDVLKQYYIISRLDEHLQDMLIT